VRGGGQGDDHQFGCRKSGTKIAFQMGDGHDAGSGMVAHLDAALFADGIESGGIAPPEPDFVPLALSSAAAA
jgi:hypothetical protein